MNRAYLIGLAFASAAVAGCADRPPPPPLAPETIITCRVTATFCSSGSDMTGDCMDPMTVDLSAFPDMDPLCAPLVGAGATLTPAEQGAFWCERLLNSRCECLRDGTCDTCTVEFVEWDGRCPVTTGPRHDGVVPRPRECPHPDAGPPVDAEVDGGVPFDGDVEDAGPPDAGCVEPDAGPDGGVVVPPTDRHQILSFLYDHPTIGATAFRTIDLPPDLSPPAAIAPEGLLWAISDLGHLVAWDLSAGTTLDISDALIDLNLAAVTPGGSLTVSSFELYLPPVGEAPDPEDPPAIPIDPPVDHVYALVGAEEGLFLFRVHLTNARLEASIRGVNVEEAAFNGEPTLEAERYTVFSSTMPNTLSLTTTLGVAAPIPGPELTGEPLGLGVVALDFDAVYLANVSNNRLERHFGSPPVLASSSPPSPDEIVSVGGPDEWIEFTFADIDGDGVLDPVFPGAVNDASIASSREPLIFWVSPRLSPPLGLEVMALWWALWCSVVGSVVMCNSSRRY